jgi:DNA-binding NtrC family response regulator
VFSPAALAAISAYSWPGNVRELRNAVERAHILTKQDRIDPECLPIGPIRDETPRAHGSVSVEVGTPIEEMERKLILATLEELGGDKGEAAKRLGISVKTLYNRLSVYRGAGRPQ